MSLHIPGIPAHPSPATVRQESPLKRPEPEPAKPQTAPAAPGAPAGEPLSDQWLPQPPVAASPTYADPSAIPVNSLAEPAAPAPAAPAGTAPADLAKVAAERVRLDSLASPPQAARVHAGLVQGTVLNLLA